MHDVVIRVDDAGDVVMIFHPNDPPEIDLGEVITDRRGGRVWPMGLINRICFWILRGVFGSKGTVSDWTRSWGCRFGIWDAVTGKRLPGTYRDHSVAVEAEIQYILDGTIKGD